MMYKDAETWLTQTALSYWYSNSVQWPAQPKVPKNDQGSYDLTHASYAENITQPEQPTKLALKIKSLNYSPPSQIAIGSHQYLVSLSITHPFTTQKLYSSCVRLLESGNIIYFNAADNQNGCYIPNHIVLGLKQFKCFLTVEPLYAWKRSPTVLKFKVDLASEPEGICNMSFKDQGIALEAEFQVIESQERRAQIVNDMNYKYKRSFSNESFVRFNKFFIDFRTAQEQPNLTLQPTQTSQTDVKYEISKSQKDEKSQKTTSFTSSSPTKFYEQVDQPQAELGLQFISNIKTQAGSKQFQKKARNLLSSDVDNIITYILPHIQDVTQHSYANYMLQSLHEVCNYEQRMRIIQSVGDKFPTLVCSQQGTFVFQHLITHLEDPVEFETICKFILTDFKTVALNPNGHHFIRKMFELMPPYLVLSFVPSVQMYFIEMSMSQFGVFIVRGMVKCLKRLQFQTQQYSEFLDKLLESLASYIDQLINHDFGNYLVQEVFQSIELQRLEKLNNYIINFFPDVSCGKISSSVVLNCVKKYWGLNPKIQQSLKTRLDRKDIRNMFRNKDGNKVLLEVIELHYEVPELVNKISQVARGQESSKFNSKRWALVTGKARTGEVGTKYTSFSEAHSFTKRKHQP